MEQQIGAVKDRRSRLKARLTTTSKRIANTHASYTQRCDLYNDLESIYAEILAAHYELCELVEHDDQFEQHRTVGGMDLGNYLGSIDTIYDAAIKSYAASLTQDICNALKKAEAYLPYLDGEDSVDSPYIIEEAESSLALFKELYVQSSSINDFDSEVRDRLDQCISKMGQLVYVFKHGPSAPRVVHFDSVHQTIPSQQTTPHPSSIDHNHPPTDPRVSHDGLYGEQVGRSAGMAPRLESTRYGADYQSADAESAPLDARSSPLRQFARSPNLSDMSIVTAYQNSANQPLGYPLTDTDSLNIQSRPGNTSVYKASKFIKTPLPIFSGDRRTWSEFRTVWRTHAQREYDNDVERAWSLKSCLRGGALDCVKAVLVNQPDAYRRMWKRLDDLYCDVSLNIQSVHEELSKLKPIANDDLLGLVNLVNKVELCYSQLGEVGQIDSVTMAQIDDLNDLLPVSIQKEWMKMSRVATLPQKVHPFSLFMTFLEEERAVTMRLAERQKRSLKGHKIAKTHTTGAAVGLQSPQDDSSFGRYNPVPVDNVVPCILHDKSHTTPECKRFMSMTVKDRINAVKKSGACYRCFGRHSVKTCNKTNSCNQCGLSNHHALLCRRQEEPNQPSSIKSPANPDDGKVNTASSSSSDTRTPRVGRFDDTALCPALLLLQQVPLAAPSAVATVFFDSGSNSSFISLSAVRRLKARRLQPVKLELTTTGNVESQLTTHLYEVYLKPIQGPLVRLLCYGLDSITGQVSKLDLQTVRELFPSIDPDLLQRKSGRVDLLIGGDYCGLHPRQEVATAGKHLKVLRGPFGLCIHGWHPNLRLQGGVETQFTHTDVCVGMNDRSHIQVSCNHTEFLRPSTHASRTCEPQGVGKFIEGERLGTELSIKCGNCRCGKCPIPGHTFSFREEQELQLIRQNLRYDSDHKRWVTSYPWIKNPADLPDNYHAALATLRSTERMLSKDASWAKIYSGQIDDMVNRDVAKKLTQEELDSWNGPYFYISHLAVQSPKSTSTPVRIVFNSSQLHKGVSLNSALAKGPDSYLNNLLGVLLRWREEEVAIVGDIRKMYNSIHIDPLEQHCHRFLWRDMEDRKPDVYIIQRVNMGDRPAAAISSEAIYMTADLFKESYPEVSTLLRVSTYVDDIVDSIDGKEPALLLASSAKHVLSEVGFTIKHWLFGGESSPRVDLGSPLKDPPDPSAVTQVLGVNWMPVKDVIVFEPKLNFSKKRKGVYTEPNVMPEQVAQCIPLRLTRRSVLEQTMKIYDPLGMLSPFLLRAKVLLRTTWVEKLGWDDPLPDELRAQWVMFFQDMLKMSQVRYDRCLKPSSVVGKPILVCMSDASDLAYGFTAYIRWQLDDGKYWSRLIMSKSRISPLRKLSTPQLELNGAVLSKRGRRVIEREMRFDFDKVYHLVDSATVLGMIHKVSTRFKIFEGVRVGEIQAATGGDLSSWFWLKGTLNIADWLTRGKDISELGPDSEWWRGPAFLTQPVKEWEIKSYDQCKDDSNLDIETHSVKVSAPEHIMEYHRFSVFNRYAWTMARVYNSIKSRSFRGGQTANITPEILKVAKNLIMKDAQQSIGSELKGKYPQLHPVQNENGVWIVGTRLLRNNPMAVSPNVLPALLPCDHPLTKVLLQEAHRNSGHRGRDVTLATFRQEYWVTNGSKLAKRVVNDCQKCRLRDARLQTQEMGKLPVERLLPGPPFNNVMVDLFGPYSVRGEVQKRVSAKAYGVIFTDVCSRAVHIEAAFGYDTSSFLLALKRFTGVRGWPSVIFSDPGSQLVGAEKELVQIWSSLHEEPVYKCSVEKGTKWVFGPADSSWHQGAVESLVKAAKRALKFSINDQRLSASELMTVFTEAANLLNERPIGSVVGAGSDVSILTPNSLLIGRPTAKNPGGWSPEVGLKSRVQVVDSIIQRFWEEWSKHYAPTLVQQRKWKQRAKSLRPGDVVAIADSNSLRGRYRIGIVREVFPGIDGIVRKVTVAYKNFKVAEKVYEYSGAKDAVVIRSVQRLALLVPSDAHG